MFDLHCFSNKWDTEIIVCVCHHIYIYIINISLFIHLSINLFIYLYMYLSIRHTFSIYLLLIMSLEEAEYLLLLLIMINLLKILIPSLLSIIKSVVLKTEGPAGPSNADAPHWHRFCSSYHKASYDHSEALTSMARRICTTSIY